MTFYPGAINVRLFRIRTNTSLIPCPPFISFADKRNYLIFAHNWMNYSTWTWVFDTFFLVICETFETDSFAILNSWSFKYNFGPHFGPFLMSKYGQKFLKMLKKLSKFTILPFPDSFKSFEFWIFDFETFFPLQNLKTLNYCVLFFKSTFLQLWFHALHSFPSPTKQLLNNSPIIAWLDQLGKV